MKKLSSILLIAGMAAAISFISCKAKNDKDQNADSAGQEHVGNTGPADTGLKTSPVETGGKDSSGNGQGTTNMPKDTLKTNP